MNNGAFGENFPYSNFHDLNTDWIIKIAKDFLDQYSQIQTTLNNGLEALDAKATELENLLQEWYDTHSEDIADQLATALEALNEWYTEHEGYLDQALQDNINAFNTAAEQKTTQAIASIPSDYSSFYNMFLKLRRSVKGNVYITNEVPVNLFEKGSLSYAADDTWNQDSRIRTPVLTNEFPIYINSIDTSLTNAFAIHYVDEDDAYVSDTGWIKYGAIEPNKRFRIMASLNPSVNTAGSVQEIFEGFTWIVGNYFEDYKISNFEHGTLNNGINGTYNYNRRIRSIRMLEYDTKCIITADTDWQYTICYYDENGIFQNDSGWIIGQSTIIPKNTKFKLVLESYVDATNKTISEILEHYRILPIDDNISSYINNSNIDKLFAHGTFEGASLSIDNYRYSSRIATAGIIKSDKDIIIDILNGYCAFLLIDDAETEVIYDSGWRQSGKFYIPANQKFGFTISNSPSEDNPEDFNTLLNNITIKFANEYPYSINPNKIIQCRNVDNNRYPPYSKWYIESARKNQYDRIRVNVRRTTDGHFVLIHDNIINTEARNSDGTNIETTISSDNQTLAYLNTFDWGIKYGKMYSGMNVPTLEEACKYASAYNLGLSIETMETYAWEEYRTIIDEMAQIIGKYGLLENLIVITVAGSTWREYEYWKTKSKYISFHIGTTKENLLTPTWKSNMTALETGYNTIYYGMQPISSMPDQETVNYCMENGFKIYCAYPLNESELFNTVGFTHGITLIECNNMYMVKDSIVKYVDSHNI